MRRPRTALAGEQRSQNTSEEEVTSLLSPCQVFSNDRQTFPARTVPSALLSAHKPSSDKRTLRIKVRRDPRSARPRMEEDVRWLEGEPSRGEEDVEEERSVLEGRPEGSDDEAPKEVGSILVGAHEDVG